MTIKNKSIVSYPAIRIAVYGLLAVSLVAAAWYYFHFSRKIAADAQATNRPAVKQGRLGKQLLYFALQEQGLKEPELGQVIASLKTSVNMKQFRPEDEYSITFLPDGSFHHLWIKHGGLQRYTVARLNGKYAARTINLAVFERDRVVAGTIKNSLWDSMVHNKLPASLVMEFADVFAYNIDFLTEPRDGDKYALVWHEKYTEDKVIEHKIVAAYYDGKETERKRAFAFNKEYFNEKGEALKRMFLRAPLQFSRISSYFSASRFHPILRIFRPHLGIDYAAPSGTPVSSVANGKVTFVGKKSGFGNYIEVTHSSGYVSCYGHLSRFASSTKRGAGVHQGQVIGYVGMTGLASGPHLDFRIRQNGTYLNFLKINSRTMAETLSKKEKAVFLDRIRKNLAAMDDLVSKL